MLGQVGLLRVGLAAKLTNLDLQMFRLLVLRDVFQQGCLIDETLVTRVTLKGFVRLVRPAVRLEVGELTECFGTVPVPTAVRLVSRVRSDVLLQVAQLGELAGAKLTPVGFDPHVDPHVLRQVGGVGERFDTLLTFVGFRFPHVELSVELKVRLGAKVLQRIQSNN